MTSNHLIKTIIFLSLLFISIDNGLALGIDQGLRIKLISLSETKKTALMNKGHEDGLKIGDHAKFYIKKGTIIARAVVRKVSPSRSLWSVYRIVRSKEFINEKVYDMVITLPVKLASDASKSILGEVIERSRRSMKIKDPKDEKKDSSFKARRALPNIPKGTYFTSLNDFTGVSKDPNINFNSLDEDDDPAQFIRKINNSYSSNPKNFKSLKMTLPTKKDRKILEVRKIKEALYMLDEEREIKITEKEIEKKYITLEDFIYP